MGWSTNNVAGNPRVGGESNRQARAPGSQTLTAYSAALENYGYGEMQTAGPDATSAAVRQARASALTRAGVGKGRKSTMLTQGLTDTPTLGKSTLGGY